jgi:hypothetical protein
MAISGLVRLSKKDFAMKNVIPAFLCVVSILFSTICPAELSLDSLPNIRNLISHSGEMDNADQEAFEPNSLDSDGRITSHSIVSDSARGEAAGEIAEHLSGGSDALRQRLANAFLNNRDRFLKNLLVDNYAVNDLGVAYAVCSILLWEMASEKALTNTAIENATKKLIHAFKNRRNVNSQFHPDHDAKLYDWLITSPVAISSLVTAFEHVDRIQEVELLRDASASMFLTAFKVPHYWMQISATGEISFDDDTLITYQE